jgi:hypothetical protein
MKRISLLLLIVISLAACTQNKVVPVPVEPEVKVEIGDFEAPMWMWQVPSGSYAVGFAYTEPHLEARADSIAREYAAVVLSRNHSSFVVDKLAVVEWADEVNSGSKEAKLKLVVSSDMEYLQKAHQNLIKLDSADVMGYHLALYGFIDGKVDGRVRKMRGNKVPAWCEDATVTQDGKVINVVASALAASLPDAWFMAHEKALTLMGKYRLQKIAGSHESSAKMDIRKFTDETVTLSYKAYLDKCFIVPIKTDGMQSFKVYLSLRSGDGQ